MTVTVQAGITIASLQQTLSREGQRLPIDIPQPDRATLGGALATNTSGPRRLGAGTLRDYVIGITTINDEGQQTRAGGRVVKNVAGYDLCKLHIGALGTLGIITQVTLKVRPQPDSHALMTFGCESEALPALLDHLHVSRTRPMCIDLVNSHAANTLRRQAGMNLPDRPWVIVVGFEDSEAAVNWQIQQLLKESMAAGIVGVEALAGASTVPLWQALTELTAGPLDSGADKVLGFKASLLSSRVADFIGHASRQPMPIALHAHAASGIVRGHVAGLTLDQARALLKHLSEMAESVILTRCPVEWKRELPVWGTPRGDAWLMRQVKQQLDPRRLFNPGRFVAGI
jgi:glycolate oxidase FAD binding subunit